MSSNINQESLPGSPYIPIAQNNTILLEVDNLLANWPTYVIKYTPDQPGPIKIILRLKDVTKCAQEDDSDTSDSEMDDMKKAEAVAAKERAKGTSITLRISTSTDEDNDSKTLVADAVPVAFHGIPTDTIPVKPKFFDSDRPWPPFRPRALRAISNNEPVSRFIILNTFPAPVKAINNERLYE